MPYQYKREPLTSDEMERLAHACSNPQERLSVWTLLDTGLRVGELAALQRDHIDWQRRALIVYGKGGPHGKRTKRRVVPMTDRIRPLLEAHFALYDHFPIAKRTIQKIVKRVANRAGISRIQVTPHVLRHTFAIESIRNNINPRTLQMALGHDHLTTTEIYLNLSPEDMLREYREKW